jgi:hypothetical protein
MVPVNRDVQNIWYESILWFLRFVMPFFFSTILPLVLVLVTVCKRIWITRVL